MSEAKPPAPSVQGPDGRGEDNRSGAGRFWSRQRAWIGGIGAAARATTRAAAWAATRAARRRLGDGGVPERHGLRRPVMRLKPAGSRAATAPPDVAGFYASAAGTQIAARLSPALRRLGGEQGRGRLVTGFGYVSPYLRCWPSARLTAIGGAAGGGAAGGGAGEMADLVLLVHALEVASDPRGLLREAWQALADHGRLLLVVPHRTWPFAPVLRDTPFALGHAYGIGTLDRLLAESLFRVEARRLAVAPPGLARWLGTLADPLAGGLIVVVAVKDVYAGLPTRRQATRRVLRLA